MIQLGLLQAVDVAAGKTLAAFATHFFPWIDKAGAGHRTTGTPVGGFEICEDSKWILNGLQMEAPEKKI